VDEELNFGKGGRTRDSSLRGSDSSYCIIKKREQAEDPRERTEGGARGENSDARRLAKGGYCLIVGPK